MPWTKKQYPDSMKNLPAEVRNKAIEISNVLLTERHLKEGIAIATGISRAKDWAENHGKESEAPDGTSKTTDVKKHGEDLYVVPDGEKWAIKVEKGEKKTIGSKTETIKRAEKKAKATSGTVTVHGKHGKIESRKSFNVNNEDRN